MRLHRIFPLSLVLLLTAALGAAAEHPQMLVSTEWVQQHLYDRDVTVLEVGDRAAFLQSHILGARFVAMADLLVQRDGTPNELPDPAAIEKVFGQAGVPSHGRIVIYARDPIAAARTFFTLDYAGRGDDTSILDGGFTRWTREKLPTSQGDVRFAPRVFEALIRPEVVTRLLTMQVLAQVAAERPEEMAIIDARSPEQYCGAESGEGVAHPGHIASAVNIPWNETLGGGSAPLFRSADDLRALLQRAGVADNATIIVYCRTGMQASVTYFVLRYLG
ncbi:MAG TPA: rhodanese-like domain-containing protein, partial [Thermoanaerobaculia bacterium]|nr:rhodanese-like domain-containing protein [Thermoanaerobaculia bacterium]